MLERTVECSADCDVCGQTAGRCCPSMEILVAEIEKVGWAIHDRKVCCPSCVKRFHEAKEIIEPMFAGTPTAAALVNKAFDNMN